MRTKGLFFNDLFKHHPLAENWLLRCVYGTCKINDKYDRQAQSARVSNDIHLRESAFTDAIASCFKFSGAKYLHRIYNKMLAHSDADLS